MRGVIFKEDRDLISGGRVEAGKVYSYSPEEAQAFVDNGVADFAPEDSGKKKTVSTEGGE